jgi:hypothetical protein
MTIFFIKVRYSLRHLCFSAFSKAINSGLSFPIIRIAFGSNSLIKQAKFNQFAMMTTNIYL